MVLYEALGARLLLRVVLHSIYYIWGLTSIRFPRSGRAGCGGSCLSGFKDLTSPV